MTAKFNRWSESFVLLRFSVFTIISREQDFLSHHAFSLMLCRRNYACMVEDTIGPSHDKAIINRCSQIIHARRHGDHWPSRDLHYTWDRYATFNCPFSGSIKIAKGFEDVRSQPKIDMISFSRELSTTCEAYS